MKEKKTFVCPWWFGYFLLTPFRRFRHPPDKILSPYITKGMHILEIGPGMGYFSIPMARLTGETGKVYCIDIQDKMLEKLSKRAARKNLEKIIECRICSEDSLKIPDLENTIDFTLAFAVVHEIPDKARLFREIHHSMKNNAKLLISEPAWHVSKEAMDETILLAHDSGFKTHAFPQIKKSRSILLIKGI